MLDTLTQFLTHSIWLAGLIILFITFLESIAVIGLAIPSSVVMTAVGLLIAKGYLNFYYAWLMAFLGCFLGDGLSYFGGYIFRGRLVNWSWLQKQKTLLNKIESELNQKRFISILLGRYIGVTRPLVPMFAGMLNLKPISFFIPSFIACITWPILYLLPGIFAGAAAEFPAGANAASFQWLFGLSIVLIWCSVWLALRLFKYRNEQSKATYWGMNYRWLCILDAGFIVALVAVLFPLIQHPLLPIYWRIIVKIFTTI